MITIRITKKQYRNLLDMAYIGNWVLNSERDDDDRLEDYDEVEEILFNGCRTISGLEKLGDVFGKPSVLYRNSGIEQAIIDYEDSIFYGLLAEELAVRDLNRIRDGEDDEEFTNLYDRYDEYIDEFEENGVENVTVER